MNLDLDQLLREGSLSGPYRKTRPRVRRSRLVEALRLLLAFLLTPNPWGSK